MVKNVKSGFVLKICQLKKQREFVSVEGQCSVDSDNLLFNILMEWKVKSGFVLDVHQLEEQKKMADVV